METIGYIARLSGESRKGWLGHEFLTAVEDEFASAVRAIFAGNAILALLLSGVLQYLMGFLSILQLMVIPVLFQIAHPINSQIIKVTILKLCAFDFFHTEVFFKKIFGLKNGESFSEIFDDAGLEGHNFIMGIGPIFFYIFAFPLFILLHRLSQWLCADEQLL